MAKLARCNPNEESREAWVRQANDPLPQADVHVRYPIKSCSIILLMKALTFLQWQALELSDTVTFRRSRCFALIFQT